MNHFLRVCPSDSSHLADLLGIVSSVAQWRELGIYLGISYARLDEIRADEHGVRSQRMAMLHEWLKGGKATRQALTIALRKMEENRLADQLVIETA